MSEEFLNHIFETFAQEKNDARSVYQGIGLGMAIVKAFLIRWVVQFLLAVKRVLVQNL